MISNQLAHSLQNQIHAFMKSSTMSSPVITAFQMVVLGHLLSLPLHPVDGEILAHSRGVDPQEIGPLQEQPCGCLDWGVPWPQAHCLPEVVTQLRTLGDRNAG